MNRLILAAVVVAVAAAGSLAAMHDVVFEVKTAAGWNPAWTWNSTTNNTWTNSTGTAAMGAKSAAKTSDVYPDVDISLWVTSSTDIATKFNSNAYVGGANCWAELAATGLMPGGEYEVFITVPNNAQIGNGPVVTAGITVTNVAASTGDIAAGSTTKFSAVESKSKWNMIGTITLNPGATSTTIRFTELGWSVLNPPAARFYTDAVWFHQIPEPATALLLGLGGLLLRRRRA